MKLSNVSKKHRTLATLAGLGISRLPQYLCEPYLRSGRLVDLMPDTESTGRDVIVISPRQRQRKTGTATRTSKKIVHFA